MLTSVRLPLLVLAVLLVAWFSAGPASAQVAEIRVLSINHNSRTVTVEGVLGSCLYHPVAKWTLHWGDNSSVDVTNFFLQERSHTYSGWGTFTHQGLTFTCSGYETRSTYSTSITLVQPTATPTSNANANANVNFVC